MRRGLLLLLLSGCTTALSNDTPDASGCVSECRAGARRCSSVGQVQLCADIDGDGCNEWGGDAPCLTGGFCNGGICVEECADACSQGERSCIATVPQVCRDEDGDGCLDLVADLPCLPDERCDDGLCVPLESGCDDGCPDEGSTMCTDETGYARCGHFDPDPCLEWSVTLACDVGSTCALGECVPDCTDECDPGERRCDGNAFLTCAQHDEDRCLELSPPITCRDDERCDNGRCVPAAQPCEDDCPADGALSCDGADAFRRCGQYDADDCLERSGPVPCGAIQRCEDGVCEAICEDDCNPADRRCGGDGVEACGNYDADPCLEWGPSEPCRDGERCDDARCVPDEAACEDACDAGALDCADNGVRTCGDHDDDPCTEWSAPVPCPDGRVCNAGACQVVCDDECALGARVCVGPGPAECVADADGCLGFADPVPCPPGQSCSNGECREDCVDECAVDATDCVPEGARRCGDFDEDPCRDWSSPTPCGAAEACREGACVAVCVDACEAEERRCVGDGFELCGDFDDDECLDFGGGASCDPSEVCEDGVCAEQPRPDGLLINEVLYDEDGHDPPGVFVELHGPANTSVVGFRLVATNGATGRIYADLELAGETDDAGFWLLAHPQADDALLALADQLHVTADLQNGPDSLQLHWGDEVIDALAYGVGARHVLGEGDPAAATQPGQSLTRDAMHTDTGDNATDFAAGGRTPGE